ncbi:M13 family metallopeptidase [Aeromicrobium chenweiae]|uniref:Peptidase M13 n=1 Tax=Aeromicrobium chenweiae TaxID=2079793 RepID=A0A2S0WK79_9ACTN|nr:M13-type metalloendopeptidase [Aeromicrobium chenweiae]AWB91746.1 peptidase M13 [Aeromicrobium chenweiae]TGN32588.1 peptidase M13 [Aeromicrobium chenweiae]
MNPGIDTTQLDPSVRVQDDLFRHVNGPWLATAEIKPDRATAGSFVALVDEAEAKVREIIETASQAPQDDEQRKIGDLYASFMDEERVEALGATPLTAELAQVDAITDIPSFVRVLGVLDRQGVGSVLGMYIAPDRGNPDRYITHLGQGGIGLPDESYYRDEESAQIREAYVAHLTTMLGLAGLDDAAGRAARIMDLETRLASFHWDRVANRDAQKTYNHFAGEGLQQLAPSFDWTSWSAGAQVPAPVLAEVVVSQPSFLEGLETLLVEDELDAWKDWLRWQVVHSASPYLSSAFVDANFEFYGRTLSGTDELRPRWKRGVGFVEGAMGEAVGKIYVRTEFPPASKERMTELIANLLEAYRQSIARLTWMSDETKKRAQDKLDSFNPKIGHPDQFKDYSALETAPDDLLGNVRRAIAVATDRELAKIGSPIDRDEWYMTPQTVNAYYNPTMNEIVFPAAILQPPFFHADADDAVNYGAIGAVIGHEIGHGFDDQGSQYDGTGALRNWWTDEDRASFEKLTSALIAQYDVLSPVGADGRTVNGSLTIGENIGDLGGLGIAYQAFRLTDPADEPIDGLSPDQRFFISWAQAWQAKVRPAETVRRLTVDPHSPPEFRCNQTVRNIDAFYAAFDVSPDDRLWLDEEERVRIW